jgi:hypothetical protein
MDHQSRDLVDSLEHAVNRLDALEAEGRALLRRQERLVRTSRPVHSETDRLAKEMAAELMAQPGVRQELTRLMQQALDKARLKIDRE